MCRKEEEWNECSGCEGFGTGWGVGVHTFIVFACFFFHFFSFFSCLYSNLKSIGLKKRIRGVFTWLVAFYSFRGYLVITLIVEV